MSDLDECEAHEAADPVRDAEFNRLAVIRLIDAARSAIDDVAEQLSGEQLVMALEAIASYTVVQLATAGGAPEGRFGDLR